jgi:hypothetical protein
LLDNKSKQLKIHLLADGLTEGLRLTGSGAGDWTNCERYLPHCPMARTNRQPTEVKHPQKIFSEMGDYEKSEWYQLYSRAMLELEHALMAGRIMGARSEILRRLETLRDIPGLHEHERQAIQDALSGLNGLEREEIRYVGERQREAAKLALDKLRSIGPAIERADGKQSNEG